MSVMNMLSDTAPVDVAPPPAPAPPSPEKVVREPPAPASVAPIAIKIEAAPPHVERAVAATNGSSAKDGRNGETSKTRSPAASPFPAVTGALGPPGLTVRATEEAFAAIVDRGDASDLEEPGFEAMRDQWTLRTHKRAAETEAREGEKRKVRPVTLDEPIHMN